MQERFLYFWSAFLRDYNVWVREMATGKEKALTTDGVPGNYYYSAYISWSPDSRMDKIWWNEQWLGYPVNESYREASNVENAHLLRHLLGVTPPLWEEIEK